MKTLLVNRKRMEAELISYYLVKNGFEVTNIVSSGYDALEYLKQNHVDLVLIDMLIRGIDGIQALRFLRRKFGFDIKALLIYDVDETWVKRKSYDAGSDGFISKDMKPEEMLRIIRSL